MKLSQEQVEALWQETPSETNITIEAKDQNDLGVIKVIIFSRDGDGERSEPLYLDLDGREVSQEEYGSI